MDTLSRYIEPLAWHLANSEAAHVYRSLESDMTAERVTIDVMVDEKLGQLLEYAVSEVPYYQLPDLRQAVADLPPKEALLCFPVLTKTDIQRLGDQLRGSDRRGAQPNHSGGSTGHILAFLQDSNHLAHASASRRLGYKLSGWRPGWPILLFWGERAKKRPLHKKLIGSVRDTLYRTEWHNAFAPDERALERVASSLCHQQSLLVGYASSLGHLARYLRDRGRTVPTIGVQATADTLPDDLRLLLTDVFQSEVFSRYGSREVSVIAHEWSDHEGLYVMERNNYVEILDDESRPCAAGNAGRIIVTNLNNYAMPFIRYDIGDAGYWYAGNQQPVSGLLRLGNVLGRDTDLILGPSGTSVYVEFFSHLFYSTPGVEQFQVIQDDRSHLMVKIVAKSHVDHGLLEKHIRDATYHYADPGFSIDFEYPTEIPTTPSGKRRYVYRTWNPG